MFSKQKLYENTFLLIYLRVQLKGYFFSFSESLKYTYFYLNRKIGKTILPRYFNDYTSYCSIL